MPVAEDETIAFGTIRFTSNQKDAGGRAYKDRGWYEEYRNPLYQDIQRTIAPAWVIDVGANYGLTMLFSRERFPQAHIIGIEPYDTVAAYIRRNAEANGLTNYELFEGVVGRTLGADHEFNVHEQSSMDSRVKSPGPQWRTVRVPQTTLDHLCRDVGDEDGVYLKVDTQGYEENVFRGGERFLTRNRNWVVKTEFAPDWLRSQGTLPSDLLHYLMERYAVSEVPVRPRFGLGTLAEVTRRQVEKAEIDTFLDHVENLNRRKKGWVDLLLMPKNLREKLHGTG